MPRADNRWVISSGPFAVHVVGTEFEVGWNARAEALDIVMKKGRVRVAGPCIEGEGREDRGARVGSHLLRRRGGGR